MVCLGPNHGHVGSRRSSAGGDEERGGCSPEWVGFHLQETVWAAGGTVGKLALGHIQWRWREALGLPELGSAMRSSGCGARVPVGAGLQLAYGERGGTRGI